MDLGTNLLGHTGVCDEKIGKSFWSHKFQVWSHSMKKWSLNKCYLLLTNFVTNNGVSAEILSNADVFAEMFPIGVFNNVLEMQTYL